MNQHKFLSKPFVGIAIVVLFLLVVKMFNGGQQEEIVHGRTVEGKVQRVVDGDTIVVQIHGEKVKVRLSGVDTPESVGDYADHPEFYGKEASDYTRLKLMNRVVYLEEDVKLYDKYDRYLAYVWLVEPKEGVLKEDCFNAILIEEGYGTWFDDYDNKLYADVFESLEKEAMKQNIGLWGKSN